MSSSVLYNNVFQAKINNVQNQADTSAVYSAGVWSFKNSTALTSVTIDNSGNVGIGTASPTRRLHVSSGETVQLVMTSTGATSGFQGYTNAGSSPVGAMDFTSSGMIFYTGNGTSGAPERMRIDASGNLLVGTTASQAKIVLKQSSDGFGGGLQYVRSSVDRRWEFVTGGDDKLYIGYGSAATPSAVGNFATNGVYTATSDLRKKRDLDYNFSGLNLLNEIKPALGRMLTDSDESPLRPFFIAQDVVKTLPSLVSSLDPNPEANDPIMGVDYASFTPVLVKAIQELSAKVDAQAAEIEALKNK